MSRSVLVARLDSAGDVLLTGPAIRAVAASSDRVVLLCGRRGVDAARLLPDVDELMCWTAPWIDADPAPVAPREIRWLIEQIARRDIDEAVIFTSFHQSALPLALLLRLAGVARVSAASDDYPGSLLDVRHRVEAGVPEALRALSIAAAAGFDLPDHDDGRLRVRDELPDVGHVVRAESPYVVVHPGASAPAREWPARHFAELVPMLADSGLAPVVTGSPDEAELTSVVAGDRGADLGGQLSFAELAAVIKGASAIVVGNTGPAHLAAAVGTPVVSLFAPTVPASQWRPHRVPHILLGDQSAPCKDTRARRCPVDGHPCLSNVAPTQVLAAVRSLVEIAGEPVNLESPDVVPV
jgi:ADP-heptose:LPS heptosyltransferase